MSMFKALSAILALTLPISAMAQTTGAGGSNSLRGKHGIEISFGLLSEVSVASEISSGGVSTSSEANGFIGSLRYNYWFANEWALDLSLGVANADASTSVSGSGAFVESAAVIPMLFGVKYNPLRLGVAGALRPYLSAALGPYFGFASNVRGGASSGTESYSETTIGSRAGVGIDWSLSRRFTLGLAVAYRLVGDFERRIGSEKNYSSPEFSLSFGILLGRGAE